MKIRIIVISLILVLLCSACGAEKEPESKSVSTRIGDQSAVVTLEPGTYSAGAVQTDKGTYTFAWDKSGDLKITYPDGSGFTYRQTGNVGSGLASPTFDPESKGYLSGMTMVWGIESAIDQMRPARKDGPNPLLAIFLLAVGAWNTFAPRAAWYLSYGWRFKNAEPSDAALAIQIIGGVICLLVGLVCLLAASF